MIKVLIVDDSSFFRKRISKVLAADPKVDIVSIACDGIEAIEKNKQLEPDIITMDIEMPKMNGIDAIKKIVRQRPVTILIFSSLTYQHAEIAIEALHAGVIDFLPKNLITTATHGNANNELIERIHLLFNKVSKNIGQNNLPIVQNRKKTFNPIQLKKNDFQLILIGASTGGPVAVEKILTLLPKDFHAPLLLIQHMPSAFTGAFAKRLNRNCKVQVKEAGDNDMVRPGVVYIAPGDKQMKVKKDGCWRERLYIEDSMEETHYHPSIDITFQSAAENYNGKILAIILTGMGSDGCEGAKYLKERGATIWAQDAASSIVYGMPKAVINANIADTVLSVDEIGAVLSSIQ